MTKKQENKQVVTVEENSLLLDSGRFEHAQRVAKMLANSTMVPEHFRNNIGNCVIALNYANRVGIDPFMAMQKMYVIHGKPAIETQLQIALFNKSGRFSSLNFKLSGAGENKACVAYATDKDVNEVITGPEVSIKMARAEGWFDKKGSKWQTLPDLMLRYRAAAFFIRLYAPETTLGLYTAEELQDVGMVIDVTPEQSVEAEKAEAANSEDFAIDDEIEEPAPELERENPAETEPEEQAMSPDEQAEIEAEEQAEANGRKPAF